VVASSVVCQLELFQLFSRRFASAAVDGRCGLYRNEKNSVCRGRGSVKFYRPTLYGGRQARGISSLARPVFPSAVAVDTASRDRAGARAQDEST